MREVWCSRIWWILALRMAPSDAGLSLLVGLLADLIRFLRDINRREDRGSEMRFLRSRMDAKEDKGGLEESDVVDLYREEVRGGKFWGVAHDLAVIGEKFEEVWAHGVLPTWYAKGERAPVWDEAEVFKAKFDHVWYEEGGLRVKERADMDGDGQPMPNEIEPSDHKCLRVVFDYI